jgi:hypothetical protein
MSIYLVSTRFNNETWEENSNYRIKHKINCIYGTPLEFSSHICVDANVFVVEMNNSENKIEGVGLVKNRPCMDKYYKIYHEGNYNRYIYKSDYRLSREQLLTLNSDFVRIFDCILFKGKTHLKRGSGFTTISEKLIKRHSICENINIIRSLREIFIQYFT